MKISIRQGVFETNSSSMNTYTVEIKEVLRREVEIEAYSSDDAHDKVMDKYYDGDIVLDSDDACETEFCVLGVR